MGLIKAGIGAVSGALADQWIEYFYCEALPETVMVTKGRKQISGRSSNTKGEDNIISNGAGVAVADGQAMMIVEDGKIVDFSIEPGNYTFNSAGEPSIFAGEGFAGTLEGIGEKALKSLESAFERFKHGGSPGKDTRIYYFNTKELVGNKYGTPQPIPFRAVDTNIGLDIDISIRCFGEYSYKIENPMLFYKNVCGNVSEDYLRETIDSQLKSELITALQPALGKISSMGVRYTELINHTQEIADALNEFLTQRWMEHRGLRVVSFGMNPPTPSEEDAAMIKELQRTATLRNPNMAAAVLVDAQADAMRSAASNTQAGPAFAFMGMNMANNAGGMNAQQLFQMGQQAPQMQPPGPAVASAPAAAPAPSVASPAAVVGVAVAADVSAPVSPAVAFAPSAAEPVPAAGWTCECGTVNTGKFCAECGKARPAAAKQFVCDKCGWMPADQTTPPKFCPECGDRFDTADER